MWTNRVFCNKCGNPYDEYVGDGNCPHCKPEKKESRS